MTVGILPNVSFTSQTRAVNSAKSARFRTGNLRNNQKKPKKGGDKSAVAKVKDVRQLGCVFQDTEPPKLPSILRKSSDMQKPIQRVKFTKTIARHTKIRDQNPSLGLILPR